MAFVHEPEYDLKIMHAIKQAVRIGLRMTTVDLELSGWDDVQKRDRLIGVSLTGVMDFVDALQLTTKQCESYLQIWHMFAQQCAREYAYEMRVPEPLLVTCIKPSGTLSQLPTVSSGVHRSFAPFYIRRVRISSATPLAKTMLELGYPVYPESTFMLPEEFDNLSYYDRMTVLQKASTWVIEFPIKTAATIKSSEESALDQFNRYLSFQKYWTDHNTSITISYNEHEVPELIDAIYDNWDQYVGISFIPKDSSLYPLMPYEAISREEYYARADGLTHVKPQRLIDALSSQSYVYADDLDIDCATGVCPPR